MPSAKYLHFMLNYLNGKCLLYTKFWEQTIKVFFFLKGPCLTGGCILEGRTDTQLLLGDTVSTLKTVKGEGREIKGCRDSTCCACRGPELHFQHPCGMAYDCLSYSLQGSQLCSVLCRQNSCAHNSTQTLSCAHNF